MPRANRWSPSARVYAFDPLSFTTDRWKCTVDAYTIGKARGALYVALGQVRYFDAHAQVEGMTYEQVVPYIRTVFGLNTRAKWDGSRLWCRRTIPCRSLLGPPSSRHWTSCFGSAPTALSRPDGTAGTTSGSEPPLRHPARP